MMEQTEALDSGPAGEEVPVSGTSVGRVRRIGTEGVGPL